MSVAQLTTDISRVFGASSTAPTASPVTVATTTGGTVVIAANTSRKRLILQNTGTEPVILRFGGDPSTSAYNYVLKDGTAARDGLGDTLELYAYTGAVKGIVEANSGVVAVTEFL